MPVNAVVNFAPAAATRRSPESAMPRPAPAQAPLMPTTTGTRSPARARISGLYSSSTTEREPAAFPRSDSTCSARSCPTQNARPEPVSSTARTDASAATSWTAASSSRRIAEDSPGRCRVRVATPPASSLVTVSDIVVLPLFVRRSVVPVGDHPATVTVGQPTRVGRSGPRDALRRSLEARHPGPVAGIDVPPSREEGPTGPSRRRVLGWFGAGTAGVLAAGAAGGAIGRGTVEAPPPPASPATGATPAIPLTRAHPAG